MFIVFHNNHTRKTELPFFFPFSILYSKGSETCQGENKKLMRKKENRCRNGTFQNGRSDGENNHRYFGRYQRAGALHGIQDICVHEPRANEELYTVSAQKNTLAKLIVVNEINGVKLEELIHTILEKGSRNMFFMINI